MVRRRSCWALRRCRCCWCHVRLDGREGQKNTINLVKTNVGEGRAVILPTRAGVVIGDEGGVDPLAAASSAGRASRAVPPGAGAAISQVPDARPQQQGDDGEGAAEDADHHALVAA